MKKIINLEDVKKPVPIVQVMFLMPVIIIGLVLVIAGGVLMYKSNIKTQDYIKTEGAFIGTKIYNVDEDGITTYSLVYAYGVDGKVYTVETDYGTEIIPEYGSKKEIKYNPDNPKDAIIEGMNSFSVILLVGIIFILISLAMMGNSKFVPILVLVFIGVIVTIAVFSIGGKAAILVGLIPIGMTVVGIIALIGEISTSLKKRKNKRYKINKYVEIDRELTQEEKIKYYKDERITIADLWMPIVGLIELIAFLVFKLSFRGNVFYDAEIFGLGLILFWILISSIFSDFIIIKPKIRFRNRKLVCIVKGKKYKGWIKDTIKDKPLLINLSTKRYEYNFKILYKGERKEKIAITPIVLFNPNKLTSEEVTVYEYMDMIYVAGYSLENNNSAISEI